MKIVRGIAAGILVATLGAGLAACGPIGVPKARLVEMGGETESALDGHVRFGIPYGGGKGDVQVRFERLPLPADRPAPPGVVFVGDMVKIGVEGSITRGRIGIDYDELPAGVRPDLLTVYGWSADLSGWVALTGTVTDSVDRAVWADTIMFDSFVIGTWKLASAPDGDAFTTGTGTTLPVKPGTNRSYWAYTRAAEVASLERTLEHLAGTPQAISCDPRAANVTVTAVSAPAGRFDACVLSSTGKQQVRVRNRFPFPMTLDLPKDGSLRPAAGTGAPGDGTGSLGEIRNTVLTYLDNSVVVGAGQTLTLDMRPGTRGPVQLAGRLDWSGVALDAGLQQLDMVLPVSKALEPAAAASLLQALDEFGAAARADLAKGDVSTPAARSLLQKAGLSESARGVGDVFVFSSCVLERLSTVAAADRDVPAGVKTTGPTVALLTSECLNTVYDKYLPAANRSAGSLLDTLKTMTATLQDAIPKADRKLSPGQVTVTVTAR